ncbi:adhesion G-protein coupled receptor G6-like isoform X1 [Hemibagrus wyckioides]|uniref:adhesion G-protein coupled receptor G6-like isoform X1 n=1 Tax=Hemibagrus wyckioides TaxID=337641 RepID=UPI00266B45A9|nr:adhesion G-protein coupled receptor G6-like isoform X1 [Hemibagrus wyckioides]
MSPYFQLSCLGSGHDFAERTADMKPLYFLVLLIFGAVPNDGCNATEEQMGKTNITCNVTTCESAETLAFIPNMDVTSRTKLQKTCRTSDKYIRAEKYYIHQLINLCFEGPNTTYDYENFKMTVVKMNMMNATDGRLVKISAPKLSDDDPPIDIFIPSEPFLNISVEQYKLGIVTYPSAQQFINDPNIQLKSKVIRVESFGCEIKNLSSQLVINFPVNSSEIIRGNYKLSCRFFDETVHRWKEVRSDTNLENSNNTVNCSYNHMALFAVFQKRTCNSHIDENIFHFNSIELKFEENLTALLCTWGGSQCYVECTSVNLTANITAVKNVTSLTNTTTGQNITQLDIRMGERSTTCNVTKCESSEMSTFINTMDLTRLIKAQKMCNKPFTSEVYLKKEKEYIDQQINFPCEGSSCTYHHENFTMTVFKMKELQSNMDYGRVKMSAPKWSDQDLPIDVFFPDESFNRSNEDFRVGIVRYGSAEKFNNNSNTELKSQVIRVEIVGNERKNLTKELVIIFPVSNIIENDERYNLSCMFYDDEEHKWDTMGSFTKLNFTSKTVNCSYNHMTPFAVFQKENRPCITHTVNTTQCLLTYDHEELNIHENLTTLLCTWGDSQCYVECTSVNCTTNTTGVKNLQNQSISALSMRLFFNINEQSVTCNVTKCDFDEINALIRTSSSSQNLRDLKRTGWIYKMCVKLASDSRFKNTYISAEKKYIDFLIASPFDGTSKNYDLEEFNMTVFKMNTTDLGLVQISAPTVPTNRLPLEVFVPTEAFKNVPVKQHRVGIVTYPSATQFMDSDTQIKSKVIRVEAAGHDITDLSTRLAINFTLNYNEKIPENYTLSCQFYNEKVYHWEKTGSFTDLENFNSSNTVNCSYDHMTPFAVLLAKPDLDAKQWKILSAVSYIGCSLSSFFSAVTIFLYTFMKTSDRDTSIRIHVSLSVAVFLLNTSFLFTEWAATWPEPGACVFIAVIIQYSLLSCFSWMAIEALHLYLLLIKVFNTYIKLYTIKLSLFGWGVPAVLVGGSLCVYKSTHFYGTREIKFIDTNETTEFCWIVDDHFLYGMNITYFSITFLFNTSILVAVTRQIFKLRCLNVRGKKPLSRKDICTVLGLTLLLGMTWGLAFFMSGHTNYPILYLFCICNTLQGLFLFLWFYSTMKRNRKLVTRSSTMSEPISAPVKNIESSFSY